MIPSLRRCLLSSVLLALATVGATVGAPALARAADAPAKPPAPGAPGADDEEGVHVVTPAMQKQIDEAIAKGAAWLRKQQGGDGGFGSLDFGGNPHYQQGLASLTGLALVAAGDTKDDPWMKALVEFAKKRDATEASGSVRTTYGTGVLIMFLTELYRNKPGKTDARYATKKKEGCGLPKDIASWIQELASWIVSVQLDDGWWRYPHTPPSDLSNTQYALLGLRAARDCGADVPLSRFVVALERCLATQQQDGKKMLRVIPPDKPGEKSYSVDSGDRARGWSYQGDPTTQMVTGSMTTAAIAVLAICRDALLKPTRYGGYTDDLDRKVGRAVQDGFTWLDANWAVDYNPPRGAPAWHYYYLYGLERAAAYAGRMHVGAHDWYLEGAKLLLAQQKPEGRWSTGAIGAREITPSDLCDTAWAILFLKKATRPTQPIPAPLVTTGK